MYKYNTITLAEAAEIMVDILNNWEVWDRSVNGEITKMWLTQKETKDAMKIAIRKGKLWYIMVWTDEDIIDYTIKED